MTQPKRLAFITLTSVLLTSMACEGRFGVADRPSERAARAVIESGIAGHGNQLIKLVGFKKTNGVAHDVTGHKLYELDYEAEIELLSDCRFGQKELMNGQVVIWAQPMSPGGTPMQGFFDSFEGTQKGQKGQRAKVTGKLLFEKTERGWRAPDGQVF